MTKLNQFSSEFDAFFSRENNQWIGGAQCLTTGEHCSQGIWGKREFDRMLEEATWRTEHDWLGSQGFPCKAGKSYFLG